MDLFSRKAAADPVRLQAFKRRVVEALGLDDDAVVMITELACEDADCPDVEVVVAVLRQGQAKLQIKLDSALSDMDDAAISEACRLLKTTAAAQHGATEVLA